MLTLKGKEFMQDKENNLYQLWQVQNHTNNPSTSAKQLFYLHAFNNKSINFVISIAVVILASPCFDPQIIVALHMS